MRGRATVHFVHGAMKDSRGYHTWYRRVANCENFENGSFEASNSCDIIKLSRSNRRIYALVLNTNSEDGAAAHKFSILNPNTMIEKKWH